MLTLSVLQQLSHNAPVYNSGCCGYSFELPLAATGSLPLPLTPGVIACDGKHSYQPHFASIQPCQLHPSSELRGAGKESWIFGLGREAVQAQLRSSQRNTDIYLQSAQVVPKLRHDKDE